MVWYFVGSERLEKGMKEEIDRIRRSHGRILVPTIVLSGALYIAENERVVSQEGNEVLDFEALYEKSPRTPGSRSSALVGGFSRKGRGNRRS